MSKKVKDKQRAKFKLKRKEVSNKLEANIIFRCLGCKEEEAIPREVVEEFDFMDGGDLSVPPRFSCEKCPEQMEPVYYKSVHGVTYELKDK